MAKLGEYRRKRDFTTTPEPRGAADARRPLLYVIQKHAARRLHYDFRLEHRGVLLSWAVPKGPSLDPADKRLAVQVEDHPLEYGKFEGEIPKGQYGGGSVLLWDRGRWQPSGDVDQGLAKGHLKFRLHGEKLKGGWTLVRLRPRSGTRDDKPSWLLIKEDDEDADRKKDILVARPESVKSGRSLPVDSGKPKARARLPAVAFELATLVDRPPDGDDWVHETKWDGVRLLATRDRERVRLLTRGGQDWASKLPTIVKAIAQLPAQQVVLDGEAVVLDARGISRFQALQRAFKEERAAPIFMVFDLLVLDGEDLRERPIVERKDRLARLLAGSRGRGVVRPCNHVVGRGQLVFERACRAGLEGIVSKRIDSTYVAGRGRDWCKSKCHQRQEFVIAGFTEPGGTRAGLGALVLGVHEGGRLVPSGRVGTGFDAPTLALLRKRLAPLEIDHPPFAVAPPRMAGVHWVRPQLVAEIQFSEWTDDGLLRHPVFVGLRADKPARQIVHERPAARPSKVKEKAKAAPESGERILGVTITHPDRLVVAASKATKRVLARHFADVGERMAPFAFGRPLALLRCVQGARGACFFQKHLDESIPGIGGVDVARRGEPRRLEPVALATTGLVALAQRSVVELHLWGSRADDVERPDRLVFDLDPAPDVPWSRVVTAARQVRFLLRELGLESFVQTTGGKGLHVVVPITPRHSWEVVKPFTAAIARALADADPDRYVATASKAARKGRVFVDYLRNGRGATAIAPFSPRARAGAPVATPVDWSELGRIRSDSFTIANLARRLAKQRLDPWREFLRTRQSLRATVLESLGIATGR